MGAGAGGSSFQIAKAKSCGKALCSGSPGRTGPTFAICAASGKCMPYQAGLPQIMFLVYPLTPQSQLCSM